MILLIFFIINTPDTIIGEVYYKADTLKYFWQDKIILLIGNAEVKTKEVFAKAETIKYDVDKNLVFAYGKQVDSAAPPTIWVGKEKQKIYGKKMCYDIKTGEGIIIDGKTQIQKGWFFGEKIWKVGKNELNIKNGRFTTCDRNTPHYYFWGNRLKVYVDDMVYIKPLVLFVYGVPVFISPFWWFPIKKGRKSGLLTPKIGQDANKGRYVENIAYYWVINKYSDATFALNYYELLGKRFLLEGRWFFPNIGNGQFNSSYITEKEEKKRWSIDFFHTHRFSNTLTSRAIGKFISDVEYLVDYEEDRLVQIDKKFDSYVSLTKLWRLGTTNFLIEEKRDLALKTKKRTIPNISYSILPKRIFLGYLSYSGYFTNASVDTQYNQTLYNNLSYSMQFKLFRFLSVSPATTHSFKWAYRETTKIHTPTYSVSLSTNIYGKTIFKPDIRHTITPRITYSLIDTTKSLSFGLGNDFYLILGKKRLNLSRLNLSSSWNFLHNRVNPINITMFSMPFHFINLQAYATYNPDSIKKFNINRMAVNTMFTAKFVGFFINYSWVPNYDKSLWGNIELNIKKHKITIARRYDLINNTMIEQSFYIYYDLHCWEAKFNFDKYGYRWRWDFKLQIKAIPEVKIGKGILGFLF